MLDPVLLRAGKPLAAAQVVQQFGLCLWGLSGLWGVELGFLLSKVLGGGGQTVTLGSPRLLLGLNLGLFVASRVGAITETVVAVVVVGGAVCVIVGVVVTVVAVVCVVAVGIGRAGVVSGGVALSDRFIRLRVVVVVVIVVVIVIAIVVAVIVSDVCVTV